MFATKLNKKATTFQRFRTIPKKHDEKIKRQIQKDKNTEIQKDKKTEIQKDKKTERKKEEKTERQKI